MNVRMYGTVKKTHQFICRPYYVAPETPMMSSVIADCPDLAPPPIFWTSLRLCRQTILFDEIFSTVRSLCCGIPQGSVLGPLLFLLYTADLGELAASLRLSSHFFTDDSQLHTWGPSSTIAQQRSRMELWY